MPRHINITRAQRRAAKIMYDRSPLYFNSYGNLTSNDMNGDVVNFGPISYKEFRAEFLMGDFGSVMVNWCGMWVGIEHDGHIHS